MAVASEIVIVYFYDGGGGIALRTGKMLCTLLQNCGHAGLLTAPY